MPNTLAVAGAKNLSFVCAPGGSVSYHLFGVVEFLALLE